MMSPVFQFKKFDVRQEKAAMKVNTDSILLGAWVDVAGFEKILDIGTGTGLIALMLAQRNEHAIIHGVEIDEDAYQEANENFAQATWSNRLTAFQEPIQFFEKEDAYDLIVCNPPFFTGGTLSENQNRNSVRHTIKLPNNELLKAVRRLMDKGGRFAVVLPFIEGLRFIELAKAFGFCVHRKTEVLAKAGKPIERLLIEFCHLRCEQLQTARLVIYNNDSAKANNYTKEYKALTKEFYLAH